MKDSVVIHMKEVTGMGPNEPTALVRVAIISDKTSSETVLLSPY